MHDRRKSDGPVVPAKPPNNPLDVGAEAVEERGPAEGNAASETRPGRKAGVGVSSAGPRAPSGAEGQGCAVHRAPAPRHRRAPGGGVSGDSPGRGSGGGRGDVAGLRAGSREEPPGSARSGPQGRVPGEAVSQELHPEGRRAAAAARCRRVGGQGPPAGGGRGAERDLRVRLPRFLLRVPAWALTARCAGRARGRDLQAEGELGARRGHPRLLLQPRSFVA
jgi:hypothetical protein